MRGQRKARWFVLAAALWVGLFALGTQHDVEAQVQIDPNLASYESVNGVSGNLNSIGSDTLNNLMTLWAEGFRAMYPNVNIQIEGKGSSTAPPALIEGTAQLGPMSRPMKAKELDAFEKRFGYKPTAIKVASDALAVFVHKDNPIEGLTLQQVDSIFSSTYKRGGQEAKTWSDVDLSGSLAGTPFSLYGRNSASGTYGMFKSIALKKGDVKDTVKEQPGSSSVVQGVASDVGGIGYSGIGYKTSGVKAIAVGDKEGELFEPSLDNSLSGDYPLARFLYIYVNKKPNETLDRLTLEFVKFVLSQGGQYIVVKDGYYPLPAPVATASVDELK
ncbi:PstS family phosphate ABC transporter substrate-binding protein [Candidatus Entotheonella palauensis]|uniref:PstS family phosphate ABC transporter substrate-binding protein n=1 Tax=Candidatus Entotheonella palauensis TaxID=93172 RepID=UPI000B7EBEA7